VKNKFDFVYIAPALLCNTALLSGIIPSAFCLDSSLFAQVSMLIFVLSIILHIYILFQWAKYKDSSPVAYGIVQPLLHFVILVIALTVGETSMCSKTQLTPEESEQLFKDYGFRNHERSIKNAEIEE
jgi:hypothetical protein